MNKIFNLISVSLIVAVSVGCGGEEQSTFVPPANSSINKAPVFLSESTIASGENIATVTTVVVDDDAGQNSGVSFRVVGGVDADRFEIDSRTGALRFREAPDYEIPRDNNGNNTYMVVISASDGMNTTRQTFAITVMDDQLTVEVPKGYSKTLKLTWSAVANGRLHYKAFAGQAGKLESTEISASTTANHLSIPIPAHLTDWVNGHVWVEGYNEQGRAFRSEAKEIRSLILKSIRYIKASNAEGTIGPDGDLGDGDEFGGSVALSADGETLAVGAWGEDSAATGVNGDQGGNSVRDAGAVYVYTRSGSGWTQQAYIKASNTKGADHFGSSVALSADGQMLAVGAWGEDSVATGVNGDQRDNSAGDTGAVYVYTRSGSEWTHQAYVKASNTENADFFGSSVALSADGQTLVVGAPGEDSVATGVNGDQDDNSAEEAGAVYVYTRTDSVWTQQAYIKASHWSAGATFGSSVALSADGRTMVAGAPGEDSGVTGVNGDPISALAYDAGAVYVYTRTGSEWTQQAYIKASNAHEADGFGSQVALSADGQTLAVGAEREDSVATGVNGDQNDISPDYNAGAAYVYTRTESDWTQQAYIKASNTGSEDAFGISVALSADGQTLVVGAVGEGSVATGVNDDQDDNPEDDDPANYNSGAAYVYTRTGSVWTQQAYVKASNTGYGDDFGADVALSADGQTLVVGASGEDSAATGIDGDQHDNSAESAGAVYLY